MPCSPGNNCCPDCASHGFGAVHCVERVDAAGGRTRAQPCGWTGICGPGDVLRWRESAASWVALAEQQARTPQQGQQASQLRAALGDVFGTPGDMVQTYMRLAEQASCAAATFAATPTRPPAPQPVPQPQPQPVPDGNGGWTWPSLPGFPGLPSLPKFPAFDPGMLLVALLIFGGGWIAGDILGD